jgi:hypothetical protein
MKKIYLKPELEIVKIHMTNMLAASPNAGLDPSQSVNAGSIDSRSFDFDDCED